MKKASKRREPSKESLQSIPEVDFSRLRRGKRGKYAHLSVGADAHAIVIDEDIWRHFGSATAINKALRALVGLAGKVDPKTKRPRSRTKRAALAS